ncbi:ABC transporter substrate-binding protein [Maritalea mobilis]|nr:MULTISPECIES: ABC transporter substrate-binding protein [Alphaproteobacteria]MBY6202589.1 ABC transporter substrate-binding protein [Maritalea mobilis]MCS6623364.1 ABC transporter substrate-binding protein [Roseibacterium beibuensis]
MLKQLQFTAAAVALSTTAVAAQEVEVLHWWTSGGEAAALNVLREDLSGQGVEWMDMPVAGGGGSDAMTVLRARVTSGNPPTAVQMLGFSIQDWAAEGVLANLDELAAEQNWGEVVPEALQRFSTYDGSWVAAPVNVHSTNWVWANTALMEELGIEQPTTWEEFVAAMQTAQDAGYTALAHGGQAWQDATIFDSMVMGVGGPDFYQASMVDLDPEALGSETMVEAFERMATLRGFVDDNFSGRDWNLATAMVVNGEALFQIMGDWAKGEFVNAGQTAGDEFQCFRVPGTEGTVTFNSDQFAMFAVEDADAQAAQLAMASAVMSPEFQIAFNLVKGSVPARTDIPSDQFDACGQMGMAQLAEAAANGALFGSMAHGHANNPSVQNAMYDVITAHFNGEYDAATAAEELVTAVEIAQ